MELFGALSRHRDSCTVCCRVKFTVCRAVCRAGTSGDTKPASVLASLVAILKEDGMLALYQVGSGQSPTAVILVIGAGDYCEANPVA